MKKIIVTLILALVFCSFSFSQSGCKIVITEAPQLTIVSAVKSAITCSGSPDGKITVTASGGTGTYQYSKDNGTSFQSSNVFTGLASGLYSIVVKDANDCSSVATSVSIDKTACISVSKTVNNSTPLIGNNVIFTITVKNNGPDNATNVNVTDVLPTGYSLVSSSTSSGTYNQTTGVWTIGDMANGTSVTLTITATVLATGTYANTATVTASETDPDTSDNTSTVTPNPNPVANLKVEKTVDNSTPKVGDNITFTIKVSNNGPSNATGVSVSDLLPSGYTLVSSNTATGTYNTATGVWTIGNLALSSVATLTITAKVNATGTYANTATVTASETDPDTSDNTSTVTPNPNPVANLKVEKTVDNSTPKVGDNITFTIKVSNNGPSNATGVSVSDLLPSGYTLVSSNTTTGTYNTATGVWTIGDLANGTSATLTVTATVVEASSYTNTATVTASETDPDTSDNTDSETIGVTLTYTKSDVTCFGESTGWIKVTAVGGSGKYYFSLDGGTTFTSLQNSNNYTFAGLKADTYYVVVKDSNGIISVCK